MQLTLSDIAQLIELEQNELNQSVRRSLRHIRQIGEYLHEAKNIAGHSNWGPWVRSDCPIGKTTAHSYIKIYEYWDLLMESARFADLTITLSLSKTQFNNKPTTTSAKAIRKRSVVWIDNAHRNALDYPTADELRTVLRTIDEEFEYLIGLGFLTIAAGDIPVMMSELEKIEKRIDGIKAAINEFVLDDPPKF